MSFLNWLSFLNEDKPETNFPDLSLVLPLTVGLGTVAVSVFLGFRNSICPLGKSASPVLLHSQDLAKKKHSKSVPKPKNKPLLTSVQSSEKPTQPPAPVVRSSTEPVVEARSPSTVTVTSSTAANVTRAFTPSETTSTAPQPNLASEKPHASTTGTKKAKKSKRPSRPAPTDKPVPILSVDEPASNGDQWVTVTSKKLRQAPPPSAKQKSPRKRAQSSTNQSQASIDLADSARDSTNQQPQRRSDTPPAPTVSVNPDAVHETACTPLQPTEPLSNRPSPCSTECPQVSVASGPIEGDTCGGRCHVERTAPNANHDSKLASLSQSTTSPPSTVHLSAMEQLLSHQLPAQLQAKELECQTLRAEIIRLREDIRQTRESHPPRLPPRSDASTVTDLEFDSRPSSALPHSCPEPVMPTSTAASPPAPRSPSPDAVLLRTLQDEIARLAKEVTLLNQRNTNMEERLEKTKAQLAVAKKKASRDTKSIREQLDTETERAEAAQRTAAQLELKLQESLKQSEIQRRVLEEREHIATQQLERLRNDCATLVHQKEQLERDHVTSESEKKRLLSKCDELAGLNQTHQLELECMRRSVEDLNQALRDAQSRLNLQHHVEPDRVAELERSAARVTELEAQMALHRRDAMECRSKLETTVEELHATVDRLSAELEEKQHMLVDRMTECSRLEAEVSRLEQVTATAEERQDSCPGTDLHHVLTADPATLLETSTQTDPEPSSEFEPSTPDSSLLNRSAEVLSEVHPDRSVDVLMEQVQHYKSALDKTEMMLSKLQQSVDQEEQRWREALVASKMESELLESKISKLEASLSSCLEERDKLSETVTELQRERQTPRVDEVTVPVSASGLNDMVNYDENTPSAELIRSLTWLRHLIRIKDEALEKEQARSDQLQSQLNQVVLSADMTVHHEKTNGHSTTKSSDPTIPNGRHSPTTTDCSELNGIIKST